MLIKWISFFTGTLIAQYVMYWVMGFFYMFLDATLKPEWFRKYKVQPGKNEPVDTWRLIKVSKNFTFCVPNYLNWLCIQHSEPWSSISSCWVDGTPSSSCGGRSRRRTSTTTYSWLCRRSRWCTSTRRSWRGSVWTCTGVRRSGAATTTALSCPPLASWCCRLHSLSLWRRLASTTLTGADLSVDGFFVW